MVNTCVVWGCTNRSGKDERTIKFFDIPKVIHHQGKLTQEISTERRMLWLSRINRADFNPDPSKRHYKVCSEHFISGEKADLYDKTNPDWAPSLKMGPVEKEISPNLSVSVKKRYERSKQRDERKIQLKTAEALLALQTSVTNLDLDESFTVTVNKHAEKVQFFLKGTLEPAGKTAEDRLLILEKMRTELQRLTSENMELKAKLNQTVLTPESLEKDEDKVKYYTGITHPIPMSIFNYLSPSIPESAKSSLSKFEKLMIVLMKVRLNLGMQDLAYRFGVSTSTVSKTFQDIIHIMYIRMKCLILWPERENVKN